MVHHAHGGHAEVAPWTGSMGLRWTDYITPKGYVILATDPEVDGAQEMKAVCH